MLTGMEERSSKKSFLSPNKGPPKRKPSKMENAHNNPLRQANTLEESVAPAPCLSALAEWEDKAPPW